MCGSSSPRVGLGAPWDAVTQPPHTASGPRTAAQRAAGASVISSHPGPPHLLPGSPVPSDRRGPARPSRAEAPKDEKCGRLWSHQP